MTETLSSQSVQTLDALWLEELANRLKASLPLTDDEIEGMFRELAVRIEDLLVRAEEYPDETLGRYALSRLADLTIDILERARRRWTGNPIPMQMTPEIRAMILLEEVRPQEADLLFSIVRMKGPRVVWAQGHFERAAPDGSMETVETAQLTWIQDEEPYLEGRLFCPGGHFEDPDGRRPVWVSAGYKFK